MTKKIPLKRTALIQRVQRYLSHSSHKMRIIGGQNFVVNVAAGDVVEEVKDLESYSRKKGILKPYEALID